MPAMKILLTLTEINPITGAGVARHAFVRRRGGPVRKTMLRLIGDESGAAAAEYSLLLAIMGSAIALVTVGLGNAIAGALNDSADCISGQSSGACESAGGGNGGGNNGGGNNGGGNSGGGSGGGNGGGNGKGKGG
jgi:Flp pilus assembly pilin Flp